MAGIFKHSLLAASFSACFALYLLFGLFVSPGAAGLVLVVGALLQAGLWLGYTVVYTNTAIAQLSRARSLWVALKFSFLPVLASMVSTILSIYFYHKAAGIGSVTLLAAIGCSSSIGIAVFVTFSAKIMHIRRVRARLEKANADLTEAIRNRKELSGLIPICCHCKKIRDDKGYWGHVEDYIERHSATLIVPFICPDCQAKPGERS